jgi:Lon protease-like protein
MSDDAVAIQVNFARAVPLFPLDGVVLLPHALLRLYVFEPRYRQMVEEALDGPGLIAMAVFEGSRWKQEYHGNPPIRRCVCLGHIAHHEREPSGNYRLVLQGIVRAKILNEEAPDDERLYRRALLQPIETQDGGDDQLDTMCGDVLEEMRTEPLTDLASVRSVLREVEQREIPSAALLEVVTLSVLNDKRLQYRLLAEGDAHRRATIVRDQLRRMRGSLAYAARQIDAEAPDGCTWN